LLERNPFPDKPPKYVRGHLYLYDFTTAEQRARTGQWWTRVDQGLYGPVQSL
jgi:hypothetical protein